MSLGFVIVGCGMIARFHARALAEVPGTRIAALVSRTKANGETMLAELKHAPVPIVATVEEAVKLPGVDAVIITTPSGAHLEPAVTAAAAGKHVVVEKPLEITEERCDRITEACDKHGVKLCTIFPSRFADSSVALKDAVAANRFGRLTLGETTCKWWRSQAYYDDGGWKGTQALDGGGALMNQAIHSVDLLLWMMGDAASVVGFTATLAHERIEVEDTAVAAIRFKSGALGIIQATTSVHPGYPKTIAIHGDKGSAVIEQEDVLRWDFSPPLPADAEVKERFAAKVGASGGAADPKAISHEGHRRQLADFVAAIRDNRPPAVDGREGRRAVALIRAIYESNRTGRAVGVG
ncbi:Gfo/Idh/MocA family protein [Limnoglobus roseus]|uniref:Putative Rossmann-fold-type glycoside hydrolase n=1 Tax=Limnoglobus roseus TaxID=2598579 RepID=A0A5C1AE16_9BACT|nr:Gfo/Idh/MocA family oxidoreductase [Limnoglobus roseus]QEL15952.1 putative Rossmann-fold-type glycoside hydrolase [Limnoglobus roseus]